MTKIYKCYICKRELDYRRHRLQHQTFTKPPYSKEIIKENIDICISCYKDYTKWLKNMKRIFEEARQ